ncbi:MAG: ribosome biogenesis GTPase Der, partial [Patescibacteria group bacterium]
MKSKQNKYPRVALMGRANVGKSSLFNRLTGNNAALVSPVPGTTRDRKEGPVEWRGRIFTVIDTGGLEGSGGRFDREVERQTQIARKEADIILLVVDLKDGPPLPQDLALIRSLRGNDKPILVVGNKAENIALRGGALDAEWFKTGLPAPIPVSAIRGNGIGDLLDTIIEILPKTASQIPQFLNSSIPRIAFVGVPNVGKSSIINSILGEERFIVSPIAHTTREPNDVEIEVNGKTYLLVDTAGLTRSSRAKTNIDAASIRRSVSAIRRADIAVLILDATKGIDRQEKYLAEQIEDAGVGCIIVLNKWDLVSNKNTTTVKDAEKVVRAMIPHLDFAPFITVSAKEHQRVLDLFPLFDTIEKEMDRELTDDELDSFLKQ